MTLNIFFVEIGQNSKLISTYFIRTTKYAQYLSMLWDYIVRVFDIDLLQYGHLKCPSILKIFLSKYILYGENVLWIPGANVSIKGNSLEEWFKDWLTEKFGG